MATALARTGLAPADLILEVTEQSLLADPETSRSVLAELGDLGVGIAVDDFGTGTSSVSALIEARSCERFEILARCCPDEELARVYRGLWASEKGHYLSFIDLARQVAARDAREQEIEGRWSEMLAAEAGIVTQQRPGPRMHSWVG